MNDATLIIEKIKKEIESYSGSNARDKKLLFDSITPDLMSKLQKFLESALSNHELFDQNDDEFIKDFYQQLGWKYID